MNIFIWIILGILLSSGVGVGIYFLTKKNSSVQTTKNNTISLQIKVGEIESKSVT